MKRIICLWLGISLVGAVASAQTLGEAAKRNQAQKKPAATRVVTDDDVNTTTTYNNGAASVPADDKPAPADQKTASKASTPDDQAKVAAEWRTKFAEQRKAISLLEREADVTQREYKQRVALYYADAGNRLRDERAWADEQRKYEAAIAAKQQDLVAARQKLEDLQEQARKAGLPSSVSDPPTMD